MFENQRYITRGVSQKVDLPLQFFMWQCIEELDVPKDCLQVFELSAENGKQKIKHIQEEPANLKAIFIVMIASVEKQYYV